ncbi:ankyrin [Violaceomyces palustris]|uniref:Ankyrin n=1 Tax=Violaceomyces palustris TaxID=1673888 RepID=A0ACD0P143_9BASI|nr:ankyrin [Violaceomyces palustris]
MASDQIKHQLDQDQIDDLLFSARLGETQELKEVLDPILKTDPDALETISNESGNTLLHYCCANGHLETAEYLLPHSSLRLLLSQNESGNTPLHWAGLNGHLKVVVKLLDRIEEAERSDPELASSLNRILLPPSSSNNQTGSSGDVDDQDKERRLWDVRNKAGRGPMSEAQMNDKEEVVRYLLERMIEGGANDDAIKAKEEKESSLDKVQSATEQLKLSQE